MATCAECIYVEVCEDIARHKLSPASAKELLPILRKSEKICELFKPSSRFVELPEVEDYDEVTTIDEAIDHAYKVAISTDEDICVECKAEHMRLCGWLGELKRRREAEKRSVK